MIYISLICLIYFGQVTNKYTNKKFDKYIWCLLFVIILICLGLRDNIGGDWESYLKLFYNQNLLGRGIQSESLFYYLMFFFSKFDLSIYYFNFFTYSIFLISIFIFCSNLEFRYLALLSSMPYLVIIVATGYLKQTLAISFLLLFLISYFKGYKKYQILFLTFSIFSHFSAFVYSFFLINRKHFIYIILLLSIFVILKFNDIYDLLYTYFFEYDKTSKGFISRLLINIFYLVPIIILFFRSKLNSYEKKILLFNIIFLTFAIISFLIFKNISTLLDRMCLYLIILYPLYTNIIFNNLIHLPLINKCSFNQATFLFFIFNILIFYLWSKFGNAYQYWTPYKNILL